ncbi:MAG: glycosyltransferase family A protein [Acidobacteriota bacterium]
MTHPADTEQPTARPRISVVMATHRRPSALERALTALAAQQLDDPAALEILVVDDASGDETPAVLERWAAREPLLRWWSLERNVGAAAARNRALDEARGRYVAIADDDDVSLAQRLGRQAALLDARPEVGLVAAPVRWVDVDGTELAVFPGILARGELPASPEAVFRVLYLDGNKLPNPALMWRAALGARYPEDLRTGEDWLLVLELLARGVGVAALDEPLVRMQRGAEHESLMRDKASAFRDQREVLARIRALDPPAARGLHRRARSRQLAREARWWTGWRGLVLALRAALAAPDDAYVRQALLWLVGRIPRKLGRVLSPGRGSA